MRSRPVSLCGEDECSYKKWPIWRINTRRCRSIKLHSLDDVAYKGDINFKLLHAFVPLSLLQLLYLDESKHMEAPAL